VQRPPIATAILVLAQLCIFWAISELGRALVTFFGIPFPGNLAGMLILLLLLASGIVRPAWVDPGATLLLRHLAFFFVPIAVGLMTLGEVLQAQGIPLLLVVLASAGAGILASGLVTQTAARRQSALPSTAAEPDAGPLGDLERAP
jgi:holin-like protein